MTPGACPDLEVLFTELAEGGGPAVTHAKGCPHCSEVLEAHRQLEKDLFRLVDPNPPPDFVSTVMARVATAPVPLRAELRAGIAIVCGALVLFAASLALGPGSLAGLGLKLANAVVYGRSVMVGLTSGVEMMWRTAALPMTVSLALVLATALYSLRRLVREQPAEISP
jgi:hypothetical protein